MKSFFKQNNVFNKKIRFLITAFLLLLLPISACKEETFVEKESYQIGETGPAGGWIFYDKGNDKNGWRYLEASAADLSDGDKWGCCACSEVKCQLINKKMSIKGARSKFIGSGKANTQAILESCDESDTAARTCTEYRGGGKDDWFLPSIEEVKLMQKVLTKAGVGNFKTDGEEVKTRYWSSTELDKYKAYSWSTSKEKSYWPYKHEKYRVRAIRAFSIGTNVIQ